MIPYHSYLVIPYSYPIVIPKKHSQHCRSPDSSWLVDCSVRCPIPTASQPTSDISLLRRTSADKSFHHTVLRSHVCSLQTFEEGQCFETLMIYEYMNIYICICIYEYQQGLGISFMLKGWLRLPRSLAMDGSVSKTKGLEDSAANGYKTSASANEWGDVAD